MEKEEIIDHWLQSAEDNSRIAEDLFKLSHFSWCLFMWHLAIEKVLKAIIVKLDKEVTYTHDLVKLAQNAEIDLSNDQINELEEIKSYNLEARYDDYKQEFYKKANKDYASTWSSKCKVLYIWIKTQI